MAAVSSPRPAATRTSGWTWWQWLALGACFAVGHGVAQRLIDFRPDEAPGGFQNFGVKPFPGQSLEALRRRQAGQRASLLVDFEELERQKRSQKEKAEFEQRRSELEQSQRDEEERLRREAEQVRLDALDRPPVEPEPSQPQAEGRPEPPGAGADLTPAAPLPAETVPALPPLPEAPPAPSPAGRP
jgi:hypothetical protein